MIFQIGNLGYKLDVVAMRDAVTRRKSYAQVTTTKKRNASGVGSKSARSSQEWNRNGSCARDLDEKYQVTDWK